MFVPRARLRTRSPHSVLTIARNPSHFTSNDHSPCVGSCPLRASMGWGSGAAGANRRDPIRRDSCFGRAGLEHGAGVEYLPEVHI